VVSLLVTSRRTRAVRRSLCSDRNVRTARGLRFASSRSAHDIALTTMSSRSSSSRAHTASVRGASPVADVAPRDFAFSGRVATSAARRLHLSLEEARRAISLSAIRPVRHATPATKQPKQSTSLHVVMPAANRLISETFAAANARGAARSNSYARYLCPDASVLSASTSTSASLDVRCARKVFSASVRPGKDIQARTYSGVWPENVPAERWLLPDGGDKSCSCCKRILNESLLNSPSTSMNGIRPVQT
jgi:hypothetical protein